MTAALGATSVSSTRSTRSYKYRCRIGACLLDNPNPNAPLHEKLVRVEQGSIVESDVDLVAKFGEKFERVEDLVPRRTPAEWTDEELSAWGLTRTSTINQVTVNPVGQAVREGFHGVTDQSPGQPVGQGIGQPAPQKLAPSVAAAKDNFEVMTLEELKSWAKDEGIDISAAAGLAKKFAKSENPHERTEKYHIVCILQNAVKSE